MSQDATQGFWVLKNYDNSSLDREHDLYMAEVPVGDEIVPALPIFTSRENAQAELRGIEGLEQEGSEPMWAVSKLSDSELVELLDDSGLLYVVIDPSPVGMYASKDISKVKLAWEFAEELRQYRG